MRNQKKQSGVVTIVVLIYLIIFAVCGIGWVKNIIKLVDCDFEAPYKAEVIRGIGIPVGPVGVIVGFMDIEDGKK